MLRGYRRPECDADVRRRAAAARPDVDVDRDLDLDLDQMKEKLRRRHTRGGQRMSSHAKVLHLVKVGAPGAGRESSTGARIRNGPEDAGSAPRTLLRVVNISG